MHKTTNHVYAELIRMMLCFEQQRKHESSALLILCEGNHPLYMHEGPVMTKGISCYYIIMGNCSTHSDILFYRDPGPRLCCYLPKHMLSPLPLAKVKFLIKWLAASEISPPWLHFPAILMEQVNVTSTRKSKRSNGCLPNLLWLISGFEWLCLGLVKPVIRASWIEICITLI